MMGAASWTSWLVDSFIAFSALLLLVLVLRRPVARWFGPEAAYMLWALPALRWLMPPLALESLGLSSLIGWSSDTPHTATVTNNIAATDAAVTGPASSGTTLTGQAVTSQVAIDTPLSYGSITDLTSFLPALWLAGVVGLFALLIRHHFKIMAKIKADADPLGNIGKVALYESGVPTSPIASGLFDRSIFIPQSIRHWPDDVQRMAVAHEMTHHGAHHLIHNSIALALLCLNWFNPLAWLAARAFVVDQEADCDARTIAKYQFDRAHYATMLLEAAKVGRAPAWTLAPHAHLIPRKALVARIRRISMNKNDRTLRFAGYGLAIATGIALLPLTASMAVADDKTIENSVSIASTNGGPATIRISGGGEPVFRRNVSYKGKTYALWSDRDMSDAEVRHQFEQSEKAVAAADDAMRKADVAMGEAERARGEAEAVAGEAEAAAGKAEAQAAWAEEEATRHAGQGHSAEAARQAAQEARQAVAEARRDAHQARREAAEDARQAGEEARRDAEQSRREALEDARASQTEARAEAIASANGARAMAISSARAESIRARAMGQAEAARIRADAARNAVASVDWNGVRASVNAGVDGATAAVRNTRTDSAVTE